MKIMGIDIGEKRIGIALTDKDRKLSVPHSVIKNDRSFPEHFFRIIEEEGVDKIIVGMPYTLKGEIGKQGERILEFVRDNILDMGTEIVYQDERFTSKMPFDPGMPGKTKIKDQDKFSAALILQGYLDRISTIKRTKDE